MSHRNWFVLVLAVFPALCGAGTAQASFQRVDRSEIDSRSYRQASPRVHVRTRLRVDLDAWLIAASDSSLTLLPEENRLRTGESSKGFREISNRSILSVEIDRASIRDFRERRPAWAGVTTPKPTAALPPVEHEERGNHKRLLYVVAGAVTVLTMFLLLR